MAYNIYKADGTLVVVPDNAIDSTFYEANKNGVGKGLGIQLNGRNAIDYGAPTAQTWIQMTENFSNITGGNPADSIALQGQLWFDKTTETLFVRTAASGVVAAFDANWRKVVITNPTTPSDGDIQVVGSVISIWANGGWNQVFPAVYS